LADISNAMGDMLPAVQALFTLVRELAARHRVTDVAASNWLVRRHGLAPMAAAAGAPQFHEDLARSALAWTKVAAYVEPLVARLAAAGVRVAPIKGLAYAKTLYGSPAERPMTDVDLLIAGGGERSAAAELERSGFGRTESPLLHHAQAWVKD